ncbi:MAG: hypothetical protein K2V38_07685 [Gemmataceae bacterium]|nr:hypothetical protein [Gemmataceae bacterium]
MNRRSALVILGVIGVAAGVLVTPAVASAQFFGPRGGGGGPPVIVPSFNPFYYVPQYRYQSGFYLNVPTMYGNLPVGYSRYAYGINSPNNDIWVPQLYPSVYGQGAVNTYGGASLRPNVGFEVQRDLARAQREMAAASKSGTSGGSPGSIGPGGSIERGPFLPNGFGADLTPADRAKVFSGETLNLLLKEIGKFDNKTAPSAFVPAMLLDDVRFGGSDVADLVNLVRRAGNLEFPAGFDDQSLKDIRAALDRDFAAVAAAVQAGKAPEPAKRVQLEVTLQKAESALAPVLKTLKFEDATATRRFLNQMANAVKALKAGGVVGLVDPKWASEGTTVAELTKHMAKHKLSFGPATPGTEESYTALHRDLATYLLLLTQPKK